MSTEDKYREGYATGFLDVIPIGDDGNMYIVPGHDPLAGFKIACYLNNEEQIDLGGGLPDDDWSARHIWVTEDEHMIGVDVGGGEMWDEDHIFYEFWDGPGILGAKPYTAIGDWSMYRAQRAPQAVE